MASSPKPQVQVFREFETVPEGAVRPLRACIIGPSMQLVRYDESTEKASGLLGSYVEAETEFSIPSLEVGATVDSDSVRLFIDDAELRYYVPVASQPETPLADFQIVSGTTNALQFPQGDTSMVFVTNSTANRSTWLKRDVQIGDIVVISDATADDILKTVITGFVGDPVAADVESTPPTEENVTASQAAVDTGATVTVTGGTYTAAVTSAPGSTYDPRTIGYVDTAYTLTCTDVEGDGTSEELTTWVCSTNNGYDDDAEIIPSAAGVMDVGSHGLEVTITIGGGTISVGDTITFTIEILHDNPVFAISTGDTYTGLQDTKYLLTVTKGGIMSGAPEITITTDDGYDSGPIKITEDESAGTGTWSVGSYGIQIEISDCDDPGCGLVLGNQWSISATAATTGAINGFTVAHDLTIGDGTNTFAAGEDLQIELRMKRDVEISENVPGSSEQYFSVDIVNDILTINPDSPTLIKGFVSEWDSGETGLFVKAGTCYVEYHAFRSMPREVGTITTLSDITDNLGTISPENWLAYGVYMAYQNAGGTEVKYVPTVDQSLASYVDALALTEAYNDLYSIVPMSREATVVNAAFANVNNMSAGDKGRWRILWTAPSVNQPQLVTSTGEDGSGDEVVLKASIEDTAGNGVFVRVVSTNGQFVTDAVAAGDYVRIGYITDEWGSTTYESYIVDDVINEQELRLVSGPASDLHPSEEKIEIWRTVTSATLASLYAATAGAFSSERVFAVVPDRGADKMRIGGEDVSSLFAAAAFAGLRSAAAPHQPLSSVEVTGFDGTNTNVPVFDESDLDILRDGGVWVIRQTTDGKTYSERQLSTSTIDVKRKEQSVTTNVDSISYYLQEILSEFVGRVNITAQSIARVNLAIASAMRKLANETASLTIGPQLNDFEIVSITVHPTNLDTLEVVINVTPPYPMNIIAITLVV